MDEPIVLEAGSGRVNAVAFSADGRYLIAACADARVRFWRTTDWREEGALEAHEESVNGLALSPDGQLLATASSDRSLRVWSLPQGLAKGHRTIGQESLVCVRFAPDGTGLLTGGKDGALRLWGWPELDERASFRAPADSRLMHGDISPQGDLLAGAGRAAEIHLWKLPTGDPIGILPGHGAACTALAFSPRELLLASTGRDGKLRLTGVLGSKHHAEVDLDADGSFPLAWRPDGTALAVGSERRVRVYSAPDLELLNDLELPAKGVLALAFAPASTAPVARLACASDDGRVRVWDLA